MLARRSPVRPRRDRGWPDAVTWLAHQLLVWRMRVRAALDRRRLRALCRRHPGVAIDPRASSALAVAQLDIHPGAKLRIGPDVATERRPDGVRLHVHPGAELVIEPGTWLRSEVAPVVIHVYERARLRIGPSCLLNGCQLSAKRELNVGRSTMIGPNSRVFDADQHPFDADTPERIDPVRIGDYVWVASDVTVLRGVEIGDHAVIGARSLVTSSVSAHGLAFGSPARVRGSVGDRKPVSP